MMTGKEYIDRLTETYSLVGVMSEKNHCTVLRMRNNRCNKDLVVHHLPAPVAAYEKLYEIQCKNLPLVYDVLPVDDGQIVLEEYIDGITVAQMMEQKRYTFAEAKTVILGVCRALSVAHGLNLVHRDVKPENIMVDQNGRVVLIDFNASREISHIGKDTVVMGTVGYASPEQLGIAESDARSDIYALGVMLNVMLTGKHPSEQMAAGKAGRIVRKCTNIDPDKRYQTAKKLANAL